MRNPRCWLRFWTGADTGSSRKLLVSARLEAQSIAKIKPIDPIVHALHKTWVIERFEPSADVHFPCYGQIAELTKDTALLWKRSQSPGSVE
jgi:hypothetical protein